MLDEPEYEIGAPPPPPREPSSLLPWLVGIVAIVVAGAVLWYLMRAREPQAVSTAAPGRPAAAASGAPESGLMPLCEAADPTVPPDQVPPLAGTDPFVRSAARVVSTHPRLTAWLTSDNIVRGLAAAIDNVASGANPAARFGALRPSGRFTVVDRGGNLLIDPRSFARYDAVADAVASVDAQAAAGLCGALKPRLVEAWSELGRSEPFDVALERAIVALLRTPAADAGTRLVPAGGAFEFEDESLEGLTPAQKQLARMGPRNVRVIQDALRRFAIAIGIPSGRL